MSEDKGFAPPHQDLRNDVKDMQRVIPDHNREMAGIPFDNLLGGPLVAAVNAQVQSAMATVSFVKKIGFESKEFLEDKPWWNQPVGKMAMVEFEYMRRAPDGMPIPQKLTIPMLTMMPIPSLRIDELNIEFLARVNSVQNINIDSTYAGSRVFRANKTGSEDDGKAAHEDHTQNIATASLDTTMQFRRETKLGTTVTRDYSMKVNMKAVSDELPAGLDRLLQIMESAIKDAPKVDYNQQKPPQGFAGMGGSNLPMGSSGLPTGH